MKKPFIYKGHLLIRLAERSIQDDWVATALEAPELIEDDPSIAGRQRYYRRIPAFGGRVLCVVCEELEMKIDVVTAFFDRKKKL